MGTGVYKKIIGGMTVVIACIVMVCIELISKKAQSLNYLSAPRWPVLLVKVIAGNGSGRTIVCVGCSSVMAGHVRVLRGAYLGNVTCQDVWPLDCCSNEGLWQLADDLSANKVLIRTCESMFGEKACGTNVAP